MDAADHTLSRMLEKSWMYDMEVVMNITNIATNATEFQLPGNVCPMQEAGYFSGWTVESLKSNLGGLLDKAQSTLSSGWNAAKPFGARVVTLVSQAQTTIATQCPALANVMNATVPSLGTSVGILLGCVAPFVIPVASSLRNSCIRDIDSTMTRAGIKEMRKQVGQNKDQKTQLKLIQKEHDAIAELEAKHLAESRKSCFALSAKNLISVGVTASAALALAPQLMVGSLALATAGLGAQYLCNRLHSSREATLAASLKSARAPVEADLKTHLSLRDEQNMVDALVNGMTDKSEKLSQEVKLSKNLQQTVTQLTNTRDDLSRKNQSQENQIISLQTTEIKNLKTVKSMKEQIQQLQGCLAEQARERTELETLSLQAPRHTTAARTAARTAKNRRKRIRKRENYRALLKRQLNAPLTTSLASVKQLTHQEQGQTVMTGADLDEDIIRQGTGSCPLCACLKYTYNWTLGFILPNLK